MNLADTLNFPSSSGRPKLTLNWRGKSEPVPDIVLYDVTEDVAPPATRAPHILRVDPFVALSGLQLCLSHWRTWMQRDDRDLGTKSQACLRDDQDASSEGYDTNEAADAAHMRMLCEIGSATDAMIDSLDRDFKEAIYRAGGIVAKRAVWRLPNFNLAAILPLAEDALTEKLKKNLATRAFF